jgi:hypothetical protein
MKTQRIMSGARIASADIKKYNEVLEYAKIIVARGGTWSEARNALFGPGCKVSVLFPAQWQRNDFLGSPQYEEIKRLLATLPNTIGDADPAEEASGKFNLRLPKSLHAALVAEAEAEGVSLNQLCLTKLAVQLQEAV